jgi:hypothetical protein
MKIGSISGNDSPSICIFFARGKRGIRRGGRLLKSFVVVDRVVVL